MVKKAIIAALISKKGLSLLKRGKLKKELQRLVKGKKLKSTEAKQIMAKLSRELTKEKKRVKKFVKKEVRRGVKKAAPQVIRLIDLGARSLKDYVGGLLKPAKKVKKKPKRRFKLKLKRKIKPKKKKRK